VPSVSHSHSILPVDHWTHDLKPSELRGLVERHHVVYELVPEQRVAAGAIVRRGWQIDLYGRRSAADATLSWTDATDHVHDVLHAVAVAVVPAEIGQISVSLSPNTGAVFIDARNDYAEQVRLRITVTPWSEARPTLVADDGSTEMEEITFQLEALGAHRR
jgi:uncharacterized protein YciU (UPF0263 family)